MDIHAMKVVRGIEMVGHLPREFSQIGWYFLACLLARSGEIKVEVIGRRPHCKAALRRNGDFMPVRVYLLREIANGQLAGKIRVKNLMMQTNGSFRDHHFCLKR